MISQRARYAIKAVLVLAADGSRSQSARDLALATGIPRSFLEQILLDLVKHGFVRSRRGRHGGYQIARHPGAVTIGDVLRMAEGDFLPLDCVAGGPERGCRDCPDPGACALRRVFERVYLAQCLVLDRTSLLDALGAPERLPPAPVPAAAPSRAAPLRRDLVALAGGPGRGGR